MGISFAPRRGAVLIWVIGIAIPAVFLLFIAESVAPI
jgi:hypothetical protein